MRPLSIVTPLLLASVIFAQEESKHPYDAARAAMKSRVAEQRKQFAGNPDVRFFGDVMADRKGRRVEIQACATGARLTDPIEFFVTPFNSGKDYEAICATEAVPSDVHKALEFIGLVPGRPVNFNTNHHWPRGPRVVMTFGVGDADIRAEDMLVDPQTSKPLARTGLVFAGSYTRTDPSGVKRYAADEADSRTIASNYNDPAAVLDIPVRAPQSAIYGSRRPNPEHAPKLGELIRISLAPAPLADAVVDVDVMVTATPAGYRLEERGKPPTEVRNLVHLLDTLAGRLDGKSNLFTRVTIDTEVKIDQLRKLYAVLMSVEQDRGVKLEPPAEGELFHRSFFPEEEWRSRENRLGEPWEFFLQRTGEQLSGRLERQVDRGEAGEQKRVVERYEVKSPAELVRLVNDNQSQWSKTVFVYPPADMSYGELRAWTTPVLATYPRVFVFPVMSPTTRPATQPATTP
ncbi:MAG: hypothetical protein H7144_03635 [Burkholderiales bacterium]|nr:hypothetical protein [Phycisphaerae bacterium]